MGSDSTANAFLSSEEIILLPSIPFHDPVRTTTVSWAKSSLEVDISVSFGHDLYGEVRVVCFFDHHTNLSCISSQTEQ